MVYKDFQVTSLSQLVMQIWPSWYKPKDVRLGVEDSDGREVYYGNRNHNAVPKYSYGVYLKAETKSTSIRWKAQHLY